MQTLVWLLIGISLFSTASAQTPTTITRSTSNEYTLQAGASHRYALSLERGESAEVIVRQQGVDVVVDVRNTAGKLLDSIDSPTGRSGDETIEIIAQEGGTYFLTVRPFAPNEPTGKYRLEVKALRGTAETSKILQNRRAVIRKNDIID